MWCDVMSVLQYCTVLYDVQCASRTVNDVLCVWLFILLCWLWRVYSHVYIKLWMLFVLQIVLGESVASVSCLDPLPPYKCVCLRAVVEWSCILLWHVPPSSLSLLIDYIYCNAAFVINIVAIFTEKKKDYQHCSIIICVIVVQSSSQPYIVAGSHSLLLCFFCRYHRPFS